MSPLFNIIHIGSSISLHLKVRARPFVHYNKTKRVKWKENRTFHHVFCFQKICIKDTVLSSKFGRKCHKKSPFCTRLLFLCI